ncbi:hypothetical protein HanRHA438_Chr15g0689611 [Helianthus annuus]|nr:hypothetical protein HanRHA438_Chr15g0689611 [Helianthus annuus]
MLWIGWFLVLISIRVTRQPYSGRGVTHSFPNKRLHIDYISYLLRISKCEAILKQIQ